MQSCWMSLDGAERTYALELLSDAGYADYLLKLGSRNAAVIEAKRASTELWRQSKLRSSYLLRGPPALRHSRILWCARATITAAALLL